MMPGKADSLRQVLVDRIRSGKYRIGSRLPGTRRLALEFEVHPNTVNKVYSELCQEGLLKTIQGSGTYVMAYPAETPGPNVEEELSRALTDLASHGRRLGLTRDQWEEIISGATARAYRQEVRRVWLVECNRKDTEDLSASLSALLGIRVEALLTEQLESRAGAGKFDGNDLVVTTPFHRQEVDEALRGKCAIAEVVIVPTPETLVSIARLPHDVSFSVVASNAPTLDRFVNLLHRYTGRPPAQAFLIDSPGAEDRIRESRLLFDSQSIHGQVRPLREGKPTITLRYQIEPTSVAFVQELLRGTTAIEEVGD